MRTRIALIALANIALFGCAVYLLDQPDVVPTGGIDDPVATVVQPGATGPAPIAESVPAPDLPTRVQQRLRERVETELAVPLRKQLARDVQMRYLSRRMRAWHMSGKWTVDVAIADGHVGLVATPERGLTRTFRVIEEQGALQLVDGEKTWAAAQWLKTANAAQLYRANPEDQGKDPLIIQLEKDARKGK